MRPQWPIHAGTGIRTETVIRIQFSVILNLMNFFCYCLLFWAKFQELHNYKNGKGLRDHLTPAPHFKYEKLKVREIVPLKKLESFNKSYQSACKKPTTLQSTKCGFSPLIAFLRERLELIIFFLDSGIKMTTSILGCSNQLGSQIFLSIAYFGL